MTAQVVHVTLSPEEIVTAARVDLHIVGPEDLVTLARVDLHIMALAVLPIPGPVVDVMRDPAVRVTQDRADLAKHVQPCASNPKLC